MLNQNDIELIINAFKANSDYDFEQYSEKSFSRRIEKIISSFNISVKELANRISIDKKFSEKIKNEITVNTTELFRDTDIWVEIQNTIIPSLANKSKINIWVAGSSSGEEAYSLLILMDYNKLLNKVELIATDLNDLILEQAVKAEYKNNIIADYIKNFDNVFKIISPDKTIDINKYFYIDKKTNILSVKQFIKEKAHFFKHDLVKNKPNIEKNFDLILCRNVLIYFNMDLQNNIIKSFYNKLNNNGAIVLGAHECVLSPLDKRFSKINTIYKKK